MRLFSPHMQSGPDPWYSKGYAVKVSYNEKGDVVVSLAKDSDVIELEQEMIKGINFSQIKTMTEFQRKAMFGVMYPVVSEYSDGALGVRFNVRGLGGWDERVHHDATLGWAQYLGFTSMQAERISAACHGVDTGGRNPVTEFHNKKARSWHFDINHDHGKGHPDDSRVEHAVRNLHEAIDKANVKGGWMEYKRHNLSVKYNADIKGQAEALALLILGEGLHPLQDIFAHTEKFVDHWIVIRENHLRRMEADGPEFVKEKLRSPLSFDKEDAAKGFSQRFTNTKLLTFFYLKAFRDKRKVTAKELSEVVREALDLAHYHGDAERADRQKRFLRLKERLMPGAVDAEWKALNEALAERLRLKALGVVSVDKKKGVVQMKLK